MLGPYFEKFLAMSRFAHMATDNDISGYISIKRIVPYERQIEKNQSYEEESSVSQVPVMQSENKLEVTNE